MAGMRWAAVFADIYTKGSAAKTIGYVKAGAGVGVVAEQVQVSFDGVVSTETPAIVEVLYFTTDGTPGGAGGAVTPVKLDSSYSGETLNVTATKGPPAAATAWTTEPTGGDLIGRRRCHTQGVHVIPLPPHTRVGQGKRLGVRVTDGGTERQCTVTILGEE